jgi:hypothetical protein
MTKRDPFDFWYAVNNTEVVRMPSRHLETFGTTILNYYLVSELMDTVDQVRIRKGRMLANQPKIITPEAYSQTLLEGFSEEASKYVDWLREHEKEIRILQYGYRLKQEAFSEHVVTDNVRTVVDRIKTDVEERKDPLAAVIIGVDDPWDVCLVKLFWEIIQGSARTNIRELATRHMFDDDGGVPVGVRREIEAAFLAASRDPERIGDLGRKLQTYGVFEEYQDRFFSLIRGRKR